jgi:hypothetical protein
MSNIKHVETKETAEYTMQVYEITYPWGVVKSAHFIRPNNIFGNLSIRTVINRWHNAEGKFRSTRQYQIVEDNKIKASLWANIRFDQEKGIEILENKEAVNNFFYMFELEKRLKTLESLKNL